MTLIQIDHVTSVWPVTTLKSRSGLKVQRRSVLAGQLAVTAVNTPAGLYQAVEVPSDRRRSERQLHEALQP